MANGQKLLTVDEVAAIRAEAEWPQLVRWEDGIALCDTVNALRELVGRLRERGGCQHRILVCGACLTEYCDGCRSYQCPHEDKAVLAALEVGRG